MSTNNKDVTFSDKMAELEAIVAWFDEDHVDIDASLQKFERGMKLATELKDHLEKAEIKVKKIQASFSVD